MRRGPYDIEADILRIATGGAKKTQLVYNANLNFKVINRYLSRLLKQGLIDHKGAFYHTTHRGHEFLRRYGALQDMRVEHPVLAV